MLQIVTLFSALAAVVAAFGAFLSSRATRKAAEAELFSNFMEEYGDSEMREAMDALTAWKKKHGGGFPQAFKTGITKHDEEAIEVNNARRTLKYYYLKALRLYEAGYVTRWFLRQVASGDGIRILYDIVEPLDPIANQGARSTEFDRLEALCPIKGSGASRSYEAGSSYDR